MTKRAGKNDIIFLTVIIILAIAVYLIFRFFFSSNGDVVNISVDGALYGSYPLDTDARIEIKNSSGQVKNVLIIENDSAHMEEATCPDKLCIKQKTISKDNESIICLPNKVAVTVTSKSESDIDVISR